MTESVKRTLSDLGSETVFIRSNSYKAWVLHQEVTPLSSVQLDQINARVAGISHAALFAGIRLPDGATIRTPGAEITLSTFSTVRIAAVTGELPYAIHRFPELGRFIVESDEISRRPVCVISRTLAEQAKLTQPLGERLEIAGESYTVVGVMPAFRTDSLGVNADIYVPMSASADLGSTARPDIVFSIKDNKNRKRIIAAIDTLLWESLKTPRDAVSDFTFEDANEISTAAGDTIDMMTFVLLLVVSISLIVGGVGVMNVMFANVLERKQEIAIKRALGATEKQIKAQIILESTLLCLAGGLAGALIGALLAHAAPAFIPKLEVVVIPWWSVALALSVAVLVGTLSGYLPALRASRVEPVTILNQR